MDTTLLEQIKDQAERGCNTPWKSANQQRYRSCRYSGKSRKGVHFAEATEMVVSLHEYDCQFRRGQINLISLIGPNPTYCSGLDKAVGNVNWQSLRPTSFETQED